MPETKANTDSDKGDVSWDPVLLGSRQGFSQSHHIPVKPGGPELPKTGQAHGIPFPNIDMKP